MPVFAYLLVKWKFVSQQMGLCVFRAQLRLRTFYYGGREMALIKCPDCGREVSSRANACPHCGCPLEELSSSGIVKIKLPRTEQISGGWVGLLSSKDSSVIHKGNVLWRGKHGETATFTVDGPTSVTVDLGTWGNPVEGTVYPRKKYELVQDFGFHMKATFRLSEVDTIDSMF